MRYVGLPMMKTLAGGNLVKAHDKLLAKLSQVKSRQLVFMP